MKKNYNIFAVLMSLVITFTASASDFLDDATLATKTKTALISEKNVPAGSINVEVSKGVVQLSGFVDNDAQIKNALVTAQQVEGAKKVLNALVVFSGTRSQEESANDQTISAKLKTEIAKVEGIGSATDIIIKIRQGQVLLAGFVKNQNIKNSAGEIAKGMEGVNKVHNLIAVK